jgi:hypothetical protein
MSTTRFHIPNMDCSRQQVACTQIPQHCLGVLRRKPPPSRRINKLCTLCHTISMQASSILACQSTDGPHTSAQYPITGATRASNSCTCTQGYAAVCYHIRPSIFHMALRPAKCKATIEVGTPLVWFGETQSPDTGQTAPEAPAAPYTPTPGQAHECLAWGESPKSNSSALCN